VVFVLNKAESPVILSLTALAIDDAGLRSGLAADGDGLAFELNVPISIAGVGARRYKHGIAIVGVIYGGLDGRVLRRHAKGLAQGRIVKPIFDSKDSYPPPKSGILSQE